MSAVIRISSISSQVSSSSLPDDSRLSSAAPNAVCDLASRPAASTIRPADGGGFSTARSGGAAASATGGDAAASAGAVALESAGALVAGGAAVAVPT